MRKRKDLYRKLRKERRASIVANIKFYQGLGLAPYAKQNKDRYQDLVEYWKNQLNKYRDV